MVCGFLYSPLPVRLGSCDPKRACCIRCIHPPPQRTHTHTHKHPDIRRYSCVPVSFVCSQAKASDFRGSVQTAVTALTYPDTDPGGNVSSCASQSTPRPYRQESVHIKTQHFRQPPGFFCRFCKAARVAVSNTSQIPSLVLAEHSK